LNAIDLYCDEGKFSMAAKYQKEVAELYESLGDLDKAISAYELAAEYFESEGSNGSAHACLLKVAHASALLGNYTKAADIFEKIAQESIDNDLLKWSVKDYLFKAGICKLCTGDLVAVKKALEGYVVLSAEFGTTREFDLLQKLVQAVEDQDQSAFATASQEFNEISKLDQWKTGLLLKVKESIGGESGEGSEDIL
jgi:alpha-soluble NSF attachment protein